ncbi:uncharacterized protein [Palaemon carinicauda]|uniref:uncharacterized protein n=1 Tax=Palaemon carinicauda TaxID=392227 RepID=UPI0035B57D33
MTKLSALTLLLLISSFKRGDADQQCYSCTDCSTLPLSPPIVHDCKHSCMDHIVCNGQSSTPTVDRTCGWENHPEGCRQISEKAFDCSCEGDLCNHGDRTELCNGAVFLSSSSLLVVACIASFLFRNKMPEC